VEVEVEVEVDLRAGRTRRKTAECLS